MRRPSRIWARDQAANPKVSAGSGSNLMKHELVERALEGGSDEEILEWCFARGRRPNEEEVLIWNTFLSKRGWRDEASADLEAAKKREGWTDRDDIQTWVDLHDAEEGRTPK